MARKDEDNYKAGVDFEWVTAKNSNFKTRKFFTKAEKEAMKAPKETPKTPTKSAPKPKAKAEAPVTKDAVKGYRKGDVTASPLPSDIASATRKALADTKPQKAGPKSSAGGPARTARPKFDVSYARWKAMDTAERKRLGLPTSVIGGEMGFNRFKTGITGKDYTMRSK
jgi:hypothetical protein